MRLTLRIAALLVLCILSLVAWGWVQHYVEREFYQLTGNGALAARLSFLAGALVVLVVPAVPLAALFRGRAWLAGALIGWPLLAVPLWHVSQYSGSASLERLSTVAVVEGLVCWAAVVMGAWLVSLRWPLSKQPLHPTPDGRG
jgi:hypothetical protein